MSAVVLIGFVIIATAVLVAFALQRFRWLREAPADEEWVALLKKWNRAL